MKIEKIVQVVQELYIDINGITLLSVEEYEACKANIKPIEYGWWLCPHGNYDDVAAFVYGDDGYVHDHGHYVFFMHGVRPALKISKSNNLQIGDRFGFGGKAWTIVGDGLALADEAFCQMAFRKDWEAEDASVYEASDIKKYLDEWLVDKQQDERLG